VKFAQSKKELDAVLNGLDYEAFISNDPIRIPKRFTQRQDIEIASFFACILAWGQRVTIINNTNKLMHWMGEEPYRFILEHSDKDLKPFEKFVHRTFNATDCLYFIAALKHIYSEVDSLECYFIGKPIAASLSAFKQVFFSLPYAPARTHKHLADPLKGSSAKRLNMFLRWMVRKDAIDFGLWTDVQKSKLMCPLDVHVQRAAMHLGLLKRKQQDWKAVKELTKNLKKLDAEDPIKYDLALFKFSEQRLSNKS
jgi:uncharacterized protein (TIGR02757 family)